MTPANTVPANRVPATFLLDAVVRAEALGHEVQTALVEVGLSRDQLSESGRFITFEQYYQLIHYCVVTPNLPEVSLVHTDNELLLLGTAGMAVLTSATLGEAVALSIRLQDMLAVPMRLTPEQLPGCLRVHFGRPITPGAAVEAWYHRWALETCAAAFFRMVSSSGEQTGEGVRLRLSYPAPPYLHAYRQTFDCALEFNADRDELFIDDALLQRPLATANAAVHALAVRQCDASAHKLSGTGALRERIEGLLLAAGREVPSLPNMAGRLAMSTRTLQRRLGNEGTSYRAVVGEVRHSQALALLRGTDLPIQEIAYHLGYDEPANFTLAFGKRQGQSPQQFRQSAG